MGQTTAIEVVVAGDDVDLVADLLWTTGITALVEHRLDSGQVLLRTDVPPGGIDAVRERVGGRADAIRVTEVDDGLDGWREHAAVARAGRRLVVHPPWVALGEVAGDEVVIELDPGSSWGHGAHPTTRLCLAALERLVDAGDVSSVLDVGCGSGALAIAAARLGVPRVVACDIDPAAVTATADNAARNHVAERVEVVHVPGSPTVADPLGPIAGSFDVVVANIGAAALVDLAPHLLARVAPDGALVLSGLLDPPPAAVAASVEPLVPVTDERLDGWTALTVAR